MKHRLTEQEQHRLNKRVAEAEKRTGCQIVLFVVERSDAYPELPWKAFALTASATGALAICVDLMPASWPSPTAALFVVAATLLAGAGAALLSVVLPDFGRLFLYQHRRESETRQYAESMFLRQEVFSTQGRTGILLLVSIFERQVVVLPDTGLSKRLSSDRLSAIIDRMTAAFAQGQVSKALEQGLSALEEALAATAPTDPAANELPDTIIQEDGA